MPLSRERKARTEIMATEKRYSCSQLSDKNYTTSITIQLPTTSANNNINNQNHLATNINRYNNIANASILNYCHHQAATRSLLFQDNSGGLTTTTSITTTESDELSPTPPPHYYDIPGIVPAYQGRTSGPPPSYDDVVNPNAPPPSYQSLFGQVREARKTSNGLVDLFRQLFLILIGTLGCTMIIGFLLLIPITMILVGITYVNECRAENIPSFLVIGGLVWIVKNILNCYNQFKKDSSTINRPPPRRAPITNRSLSTSSSSTSTSTTTTNNITSSSILIVEQQTSQANSLDVDINNNSTLLNSNSTATQTVNQNSPITINNTASQGSTTTRIRPREPINRINPPSLIGITSFKCESMLNYFLVVWFLAGCIVVYRIYEPDYDNPLSSTYCNRTVYLYAFWLMTSSFIIMAIVISCLCCLMASSLLSCNRGR